MPSLDVQIQCLHCGADLRVSRRFSGRAARCARCTHVQTLRGTADSMRPRAALPSVPSDRYRIEGVLKISGASRVYLARHLVLDEPCVVKILGPKDPGYSPEAIERLSREARAGFRINHPGVIRVLDVFESRRTWYLVMEYADGADLSSILDECGRLPWMQAAEVGKRVANALSAIHRAGLIHRDIKPANIILQPDGSVKIADLGLACAIGDEADGASSPGMVGTPPYVPPEQRMSHGDLDERADIYALGATLYHLVAGRPPQRSKSPLAYLSGAAEYEPITWDHAIAPPIPDGFREIIESCLAQPSDLRIDSAARLGELLAEQLAVGGGPRRESRRPMASPAPRIAVLPLAGRDDTSDDDWVGDALADHINQRIVELQDVHLIDRRELASLVERLCSVPVVQATDAQICSVSSLAGASTVVRGAFTLEGGSVRVVAYGLNVADGSIVPLIDQSASLARVLSYEVDLGEAVIRALGLADLSRAAGRTFAKGTSNTTAQKHYTAGQRAFDRGDYAKAIECAKSALAADPGFVDVIGFIGAAYMRQGQYDHAIEYHKRLKELADDKNDPYCLAEAVSNMGVMYYYKGEYEKAYELLSSANRLERDLNLLPILAKNYSNIGFVLTKMQRLAEADDAFGKAIEIMTELGAVASLTSPYNGRGEVAMQRGRYQEAADHYQTALEWAIRIKDWVNVGICHSYLGRCAYNMGDLDRAESHFDTALERLSGTTFWHGVAVVYEHMAELNLRRNRVPEALECIERRTELAQRHKNTRIESACWEQKARAFQLAGEMDTAVDCLRKSFEIGRRPVPAGDLYEYLVAIARRLPPASGPREG